MKNSLKEKKIQPCMDQETIAKCYTPGTHVVLKLCGLDGIITETVFKSPENIMYEVTYFMQSEYRKQRFIREELIIDGETKQTNVGFQYSNRK